MSDLANDETRAREIAAIQASGAADCCKQPANLERSQLRPDLVVNVCRVCGKRHFRQQAEGLTINTRPGA